MKVRVSGQPSMAVMEMMSGLKHSVGKAGVEPQTCRSNRMVQARSMHCKRAVHGIMCDDKEAGTEPGLAEHQHNGDGGRDEAPAPEEYADYVDNQPSYNDCGSQGQADKRLMLEGLARQGS